MLSEIVGLHVEHLFVTIGRSLNTIHLHKEVTI